jgi:hypothetical protein
VTALLVSGGSVASGTMGWPGFTLLAGVLGPGRVPEGGEESLGPLPVLCKDPQAAFVISLLERGQDSAVLVEDFVGDQLLLAVEPHAAIGDDAQRVERIPELTDVADEPRVAAQRTTTAARAPGAAGQRSRPDRRERRERA